LAGAPADGGGLDPLPDRVVPAGGCHVTADRLARPRVRFGVAELPYPDERARQLVRLLSRACPVAAQFDRAVQRRTGGGKVRRVGILEGEATSAQSS
jgi:hypothetical protein